MGEQSPFSLMPLPRSKSQIFTGDTWWRGSREVWSQAWGSRAWLQVPRCTPHLVGVLTEDVLRLQVPVGDACREKRQGGPVGGEGRLPGIPGARLDSPRAGRLWAGWREAGSTQSSQPHHPPLLCRKSRALATSCTTTLASSSLKCRRLWMWLRMEPDHGERRHRRRKGHLDAQATARHPPHRARKLPLSLLGPNVFDLSCCVDRKLSLHEPSLPCMTL